VQEIDDIEVAGQRVRQADEGPGQYRLAGNGVLRVTLTGTAGRPAPVSLIEPHPPFHHVLRDVRTSSGRSRTPRRAAAPARWRWCHPAARRSSRSLDRSRSGPCRPPPAARHPGPPGAYGWYSTASRAMSAVTRASARCSSLSMPGRSRHRSNVPIPAQPTGQRQGELALARRPPGPRRKSRPAVRVLSRQIRQEHRIPEAWACRHGPSPSSICSPVIVEACRPAPPANLPTPPPTSVSGRTRTGSSPPRRTGRAAGAVRPDRPRRPARRPPP